MAIILGAKVRSLGLGFGSFWRYFSKLEKRRLRRGTWPELILIYGNFYLTSYWDLLGRFKVILNFLWKLSKKEVVKILANWFGIWVLLQREVLKLGDYYGYWTWGFIKIMEPFGFLERLSYF